MDGHVSFLEEVCYLDSFREWLSDNLRYICLILGILIILIGVFFGVRTLTRVISSGNGSQQVQEDSIVAGSAVTASAGNSTDYSYENYGASKDSEYSGGGGYYVTGAMSEAELEAIHVGDTVSVMSWQTYSQTDAQIIKLLKTVRGLGQWTIEMFLLLSLCRPDVLPSDILSIEVSETQYSDLSITVKPGPDGNADSAIAYVSYHYINPSQFVAHPGLSWLYLRRGEDGAFRIVVNQEDLSRVEPYVNELTATPEIQAILSQVQTESEAAEAEEAMQAEASENWEQTTEGTEAAAVSPGVQPTATVVAMRTATINATCNLRGGEGYDYPVLTVLPQGASVTVIEDVGTGWCHIQTEYGEGYVGSQFISLA